MKAILVRIGIDHSYGGWNAPADPATGQFLYVPIPEKVGTRFHDGCRRGYGELVPTLQDWAVRDGRDLTADLKWPNALSRRAMHLDPDFEHLTYGDVGDARGTEICQLSCDDLLVFYAGLRPTRPCTQKLIYAIVGLFVVDKVVRAVDVPAAHRHTNAHTRKRRCGASDEVGRISLNCVSNCAA